MSEFKVGQQVVYPSHGVGQIIDIEQQQIADIKLEVYVISFPQDKMTLRVPVSRAKVSGLRALTSKGDVDKVFSTLESKPCEGDKMWSRRAQQYDAKINSGQLVLIAEVVRDLYKNVDNDRSYSERTIYETALNRLATEISVLDNVTLEVAKTRIIEVLKEKLVAA